MDCPSAWDVLDRRLESQSAAPLILALSGGGDSIALLHLAAEWARGRGRKLLALTVDHRLNPDSDAWTQLAGEAATTVGADWRPLPWRGEKPVAGLPAAARIARHRLLADAAREAGGGVILFAHTADDVAESEAMRVETPALGYLREWSPSPVWPEGRGVFALRPLLAARRDALRAYLRARAQPWIEDPANDDPRFARSRARAALAAARCEPAFVSGADDRVLRDLAGGVHASADGRLMVRRAAVSGAERRAARRLLSIAALSASGQPYPPRGDVLDRLLARIHEGPPFIATLGGARIVADADAVTFSREPGDMARSRLSPLTLQAGQSAVWDGRFEITAAASVTVAPVAGRGALLSRIDRARLAQIPASARPALPVVLWENHAALPAPFGRGAAFSRPLSGARLAAACGLVTHERDISHAGAGLGIAQTPLSSYVEGLALA